MKTTIDKAELKKQIISAAGFSGSILCTEG